MKRALARKLQFLFAFTYAVCLIAGAIPKEWFPMAWRSAMIQFSEFEFQRLRILPGMTVFNFSTEHSDIQPVSSCLKIQIRSKSGEVHTVNTYDCPIPKHGYSFFQEPSRIFYLNLAQIGSVQTDQFSQATIMIMAAAEYYCRKYDGQAAILRFDTFYQNLIDKNLLEWPARPRVVDCATLRTPVVTARHFN